MDSMLTGAEVAVLLKMNIKSVRKHLNGRKIGRRVLYSAVEIRKLMDEAPTSAQKKPSMLDEATSFDVERMFKYRLLGITQKLWKQPLPGGHDPREFLGEETFYPAEGNPVSMAMTCVEEVEGTGTDRTFTYQCPYCGAKHRRKAGQALGGCFETPCGLGIVSCTEPDLPD